MASADALVDQISQELPPAEAQRELGLLLEIFSKALSKPGEAQNRKLSKKTLRGQFHAKCYQLIQACGFVETGEDLVLSPSADTTIMEMVKELIECLVASHMEAEGDRQGEGNKGTSTADAEDPDMAEALRLSMQNNEEPGAKRARAEQPADPAVAPETSDDQALAERISMEDSGKLVEFERFRAEDVQIEEDAVEKINKWCSEVGEQYVDPQFPPVDRSLYLDEDDAKLWACANCKNKNPLPSVPNLPTSKEEAEKLEAEFDKVKCSKCGTPAPYVVKVRFFNRPTQWLRPGVRCQGCELMYSHLNGGRELVSRMCPHFLRDTMSQTTVGAPWKLIRGEARAEDVCQGGVGNCWMAGALSCVACKPELINKVFETKDYNPNGAYQLQLCHAGEWRRILIDDLLPTSQLFEGYLDGTHVYYSRGGNLCYLHCARRQLWVPLVEKAAAKLFGCYQGLSGGTFGEALALFTGFPIQRIGLYVSKEKKRQHQERQNARAAHRTQLLLAGHEVPDDEEDSDEDLEDDALKWSKIVSASESGFLMGMGCTEEGCEKSKNHIVEEMGLQAPHAYGILDAREVEVNGKIVRLMKIRNPWGERAPRTWKGDWGKDSKKWTFELKLQLGVVNRSNIPMDDEMSVFWMAYEDVKEYFAAIEICRVHLDWKEIRQRAWLPSGVGAGECFDLTVYRKTQVDLVLWQERHIAREGALGAKSTNIDVGFAVLRKRGELFGGLTDWEVVEYAKRVRSDDVSCEIILEGGFVYRIVPVSFGLCQEYAPRRAVLAVHSVQEVKLQKAPSSWHDIACAVLEGAKTAGKKRPVEGATGALNAWILHEESGSSFIAENTSESTLALQVDGSNSLNVVSTRGSLDAVVAVAPRSRQVIMVLSAAPGATRYGCGLQALVLPEGAAGFAVAGEDLHLPVPIPPPRAPLRPDEEILRQAPVAVSEPQRTLSRSGGLGSSMSEDDMLAAAMRLSLEGKEPEPTGELQQIQANVATAEEDDDEMAEAIRMSMAVPSPKASTSTEPQRPPMDDQKKRLTDRVKVLFEQNRKKGMPPNEAAARALEEARRQLANEQ